MLVEDVFEQAFDHLLGQLAASREAVKQDESQSQDKINHLSSSISHLTEQNAVLQTRLIASLDALSAASSDVLDNSRDQSDALRLLNHNLSMRLHEAHRENSELREALNNAAEPTRVINGPSAMRRVQVVANERIQPVRVISEVQQDDDGVSDAETEEQGQYMPTSDEHDYSQAGPSTLRKPQSTAEMRLRTRTILLELANELESTRREMDSIQSDKQRVVALLQSQIDSRNKELSTLYGQLDRFFGLPGFALTKSRKKQALEREQILGETAHEGEEVADALRQQLRQLKIDIERLSVERDNIARYGVGPSLSDPIAIPPSHQEGTEDALIASRLAEQEASFERVARRARERLLEQESIISSLKNELSKAQDSLRSVHDSRYEDVFSATYHGPGEIHLDRLGVGASIPRPRSAFADPHAGSMLFKEGSSDLTQRWVP